MSSAWEWWLGISRLPADAQSGTWRLGFQALPSGPWLVAALAAGIAAAAGIWWLYRRDARGLPRRRRATMAVLRLAALGMALAMLAEPVLIITTVHRVPSHLPVLVDVSQSMSLADPYPDPSRAQAAALALGLTSDGEADTAALRGSSRWKLAQRALGPLWEDLGRDRLLDIYAFAGGLEPLADPEQLAAAEATGGLTALGDAVAQALARHRGQPLAGIVVVGDGRSNAGEAPLAAARRAASEGVPLYLLAAGTEHGPRNVRLVQLDHSPAVFVRDPTEVVVLVEGRGLVGQTALVVIHARPADGEWSEIGSREIALGDDAALVELTFPLVAEASGTLELRAEVVYDGPEFTTDDNVAHGSLRVVRHRIRALLVGGYPAPEFQFLRNALLRDQQIEFSSWLQTAGDSYEHPGLRPLRRLPSTFEELARFDVLILFDPDPARFSPDWSELVRRFVGQAGGGLIYVAGELHSRDLFSPGPGTLAGMSTDNQWLETLPVVCDPALFATEADVPLSSRQTWMLELTPEGYDDPVLRFDADAARNREVIASLPGMYWHFPVTRAKPAAAVLARHGDPRMQNRFGRHVLLATQLYGPGRTVFVGFDSTYRWRYLDEGYFDGFWARLVDRVGRAKALGGRHPLRLSLDRSAYRVGQQARLRVEWTGHDDLGAEITGEVEGSDGLPAPLALAPHGDEPGTFDAIIPLPKPGSYGVRVQLGGSLEGEAGPRPATLQFRVEPPQQELQQPTVDRRLLEEMARLTGGGVWPLEEARQLPAAIRVRQVQRAIELREQIWDAPLALVLLALLLCGEWVLRKLHQLA